MILLAGPGTAAVGAAVFVACANLDYPRKVHRKLAAIRAAAGNGRGNTTRTVPVKAPAGQEPRWHIAVGEDGWHTPPADSAILTLPAVPVLQTVRDPAVPRPLGSPDPGSADWHYLEIAHEPPAARH